MVHKTKPPRMPAPVRLILISDTHEQHRNIAVPAGDILIHAGDFTFFNRTARAVTDFNDWLHTLPHRYKIVVPGNHESRSGPAWREQITGATVLVNEGLEIAGLRIWGSPVTPDDWGAFGANDGDALEQLYSRIPGGTDVLITHGPPFGILDLATMRTKPQGCRQLLDAVRRAKPRLHVFGHIHQSYGSIISEGTMFVNAALVGPKYILANSPIEVEIGPSFIHVTKSKSARNY